MLAKIFIGVCAAVLVLLASRSSAGQNSGTLPGLRIYGPFDTLEQATDVAQVPRQTGYQIRIIRPRNQDKWYLEVYPARAGLRPEFHAYGPYPNLAKANYYAELLWIKSGKRFHVKVFQAQDLNDHLNPKWCISVRPYAAQPATR
jgi:hypothetical protein